MGLDFVSDYIPQLYFVCNHLIVNSTVQNTSNHRSLKKIARFTPRKSLNVNDPLRYHFSTPVFNIFSPKLIFADASSWVSQLTVFMCV